MNKTYRDSQLTNDWIKDSGLNARTFSTTPVLVLRALQVIKVLLDEHAAELTDEQTKLLRAFQRDANNSKLAHKMPTGRCYKILNLHKSFNRKLFKEFRQIKA